MKDMPHVANHVAREMVQAAGKRRYRRRADGVCCNCRQRPRRTGGAECKECHAENMRAWRKKDSPEVRELRRVLAEMAERVLKAEQQLEVELGKEHGSQNR